MATHRSDECRLVKPGRTLKAQYLAMARDFSEAGETAHSRHLVEDDGFDAFVDELERQARGENLQPDHVPQTTYWLLRSDGAILGTGRIRHYLTPSLEAWGGHIGYDIRPTERRKGYGTLILSLLLREARDLALRRALLTCDDENVGSARVIERNGGVLADRVPTLDTDRLGRRYWIEVERGEAH